MPATFQNLVLTTSASVSIFGDHKTPMVASDGTPMPVIGRRQFVFGTDEATPLVVFNDEDIQLTSILGIQEQDHSQTHVRGILEREQRLQKFSATVKAVLETSSNGTVWEEFSAYSERKIGTTDQWKDVKFSKKLRLRPAIRAFRVRVKLEYKINGMHDILSAQFISPAYRVIVRRAPAILTFIAMGGSSSVGSSSSSSSSSSGDGITTDPDQCDVNKELISELMESNNVQCNDLCADCMNFVEHLGLRVLNEEGLADNLKSLRMREGSGPRYCARRYNSRGIRHRVVLGKWENSEHEPFRPEGIKTFESILDEFQEDGGGSLLIVAQSHAGAKLAATVNDKWRWGGKIDVALFVAWDATHAGGAIHSVGSRPSRVINFFQTANFLYFQNGGRIEEADVEFDLTGCFSHNAIARSVFVHQTTYDELRVAIAKIRTLARES